MALPLSKVWVSDDCSMLDIHGLASRCQQGWRFTLSPPLTQVHVHTVAGHTLRPPPPPPPPPPHMCSTHPTRGSSGNSSASCTGTRDQCKGRQAGGQAGENNSTTQLKAANRCFHSTALKQPYFCMLDVTCDVQSGVVVCIAKTQLGTQSNSSMGCPGQSLDSPQA
jgi:hypothetical protein